MSLLDIFLPLFSYTINVVTSENDENHLTHGEDVGGGGRTSSDIREQLLALHKQIVSQAKENFFSCEDVALATLATLICVDEIILCSGSRLADTWQYHLLQDELPVRGLGGIVFFEKLADIDVSNHPLRELYLFCIFIGFKGKYIIDGETSLAHIIDEEISKLPLDYQDCLQRNKNSVWNYQAPPNSDVSNKGQLTLLIFCVSIIFVFVISNTLLIN